MCIRDSSSPTRGPRPTSSTLARSWTGRTRSSPGCSTPPAGPAAPESAAHPPRPRPPPHRPDLAGRPSSTPPQRSDPATGPRPTPRSAAQHAPYQNHSASRSKLTPLRYARWRAYLNGVNLDLDALWFWDGACWAADRGVGRGPVAGSDRCGGVDEGLPAESG